MKRKKSKAERFTNWTGRFLESSKSFYLTLILFFISSAWIAVSALYPMAYDEEFHFGLIKLYATKLTPFWSANPPGEAVFGAVARDPSYLYHYLLSFPYRIIDSLIPSEFAQILILRFTNIVFFAIGIYLFRKVLLGSGLSRRITHASLLIFVLLPIVPLLAAHINYDNLLFALFGLVLWQTQIFASKLKSDQSFDVRSFALITLACMFGSLVKYAFLPFVVGIVGYLLYLLFKTYQKTTISAVWKEASSSFSSLSKGFKSFAIVFFVLLLGLFLERYAINTIKYSTPTPECDQVLSIEECTAYGPWRRNYYTKKAKLENRLEKVYSANPARYLTTLWLSETTFQLFFVIDGSTYDFRVGEPFRILRNSSVIVMLMGLVLLVYHRKYLKEKYKFGLYWTVTATYLGALIILNYTEFINLGYPYAIQGRYLVPILPLIMAMMVAAFSKTIGEKRLAAKVYLFVIAFSILLTQGGAAGTFILRSNNSWYWNASYPNQINHQARNVLKIINIDMRPPQNTE